MATRQRAHSKPDDQQQQLVNIEEDVAIFLGAMQSEQKKYTTLLSLLVPCELSEASDQEEREGLTWSCVISPGR
jgi:hypothetical protein